MKILTVVGARPQFIKAAAVSHNVARQANIQEILIHTGQHFDGNMSDVFFFELGIPKPAYNLGIGSGLHGAMTGAQLAGVEEVLLSEKPDFVMVYGDTNSTLAGTLAAVKLHIPVAHVEAGLRSFNRRMPEEINRVVTDHVSTLLFAPTTSAMENLAKEGVPANQCHQVGDVMLDAALIFGERAQCSSNVLPRLGVSVQNFILATIHRAENTNDKKRFHIILSALSKVARAMPVVWPVHPRTRKLLESGDSRALLSDQVLLIDPVGYLDMLMLERNATVIATDSGGIQKEAFFCGVPCVTLRDETEWVELVEAGWNTLAPPTSDTNVGNAILQAIGRKGRTIAPYGEGVASEKITQILLNHMS
jgi:UDP-GlcNAc3NAcA epimerase